MRLQFLIVVGLFFQSLVFAQSPVFFQDISENEVIQNSPRWIVPAAYRTMRVDFESIKTWLGTAPLEQKIIAKETAGLRMTIPLPDGRFEDFEVWDAPIMHPDLAVQFPEMRQFAGKSVKNDGTTIRFSYGSDGFHSMILSPVFGSIFIDPYAMGNRSEVIVYTRADFYKTCTKEFACSFERDDDDPQEDLGGERAGDCGTLHTYRLAMACTGEYAAFHGGTVAGAMNGITNTMTRVNGVYEKELSIRMVLIANNTSIIYTNSATDPYTNGNGSTMLTQNQSNLTTVIGSANYDIGHVVSTGGGGVASLNSPCTTSNKAKGVTGSGSPVGDPFDIDYVAHEMGHQFGGNHTFYSVTGSCGSGNMNAATGIETGSGTTIQAYAGICGSTNVQSNSDPYFSVISLLEMGKFITTGTGGTCDVESSTGNSAPNITGITDQTIPTGTPFVLSADATDPNGDALTYNWEQYNILSGSTVVTMPPNGTGTHGPLFRPLTATAAQERYFPKLANVVAGTTNTWEVLSSVSRTLFFRLTVRDNNAAGGCTTQFPAAGALAIYPPATGTTTMAVNISVSSSQGAFSVISPTISGISWPRNSGQTVTWTAIGTATLVDILLSTDGGLTFSTILVTGTPNDGSQLITVPNSAPINSISRIMVKANGNYYYDVSNNNFAITAAALPLELTAFNAHFLKAKNTVRLDWQTASEVDLRGFSIERSTSAAAFSFQKIGFAESKSDEKDASQNAYSFLDQDLEKGQTYYYRLRFEEKESVEKASFSPIRAIETGEKGQTLVIEPNPAFEKVHFNLDSSPEDLGFLDLEIFTPSGVLVKKMHLENSFENSFELDIVDLPTGPFLAIARSERQVWTGRFLKF